MTTRENFPWHVAIFRSEGPGTPFRYFCGGSLVNPSNKGFLILTAAVRLKKIFLVFFMYYEHFFSIVLQHLQGRQGFDLSKTSE